MDANWDSISFLESHSWLQFFIFHITKTLLFCFLWIFDFSSSKIHWRIPKTVIFSSMASLVSTSCSHICPDASFITVNLFSITFWAFCLSLWILLLLPHVLYNFITLLVISPDGSSAPSQYCMCFYSSIASFTHRAHWMAQNFLLLAGSQGNWWLAAKEVLRRDWKIYLSHATPHYLFQVVVESCLDRIFVTRFSFI